jgi:hypothetical protein
LPKINKSFDEVSISAKQGVFGTLVPQATMQVVFLPFIQFSAASAIKGLIAIDTVGKF